MPFSIDKALGIHPQAMSLRAERAEVLAGNLANADTPHYKARDIDFARELDRATGGISTSASAGVEVPRVTLAATSGAHLSGDSGSGLRSELMYREPFQSAIDGNSVNAEREHGEFLRNSLAYEAGLTMLNGRIRTLMSAIRGE